MHRILVIVDKARRRREAAYSGAGLFLVAPVGFRRCMTPYGDCDEEPTDIRAVFVRYDCSHGAAMGQRWECDIDSASPFPGKYRGARGIDMSMNRQTREMSSLDKDGLVRHLGSRRDLMLIASTIRAIPSIRYVCFYPLGISLAAVVTEGHHEIPDDENH